MNYKKYCIKNPTWYYFNNMIKIEDSGFDILLDKKSYKIFWFMMFHTKLWWVQNLYVSLLHLMRAIVHAHARTCTTSLMRVKNCMCHLFVILIVWDIWIKKMKERSETSNWIVDHFSFIFVNLLLTWNLYFHVRLQNKGKIVSLEWIL